MNAFHTMAERNDYRDISSSIGAYYEDYSSTPIEARLQAAIGEFRSRFGIRPTFAIINPRDSASENPVCGGMDIIRRSEFVPGIIYVGAATETEREKWARRIRSLL